MIQLFRPLLALAPVLLLLAACGRSDPQADVSVSGAGPGQPVAPGTLAVFRMRLANAGPATAEDIVIANAVDSRLTLEEIGCESEGGAQCPGSPAAGMTIGSLPSGGALTFVVKARVPASLQGGLIFNTMTTRQVIGDPDSGNNSSTASAVVANAQLTVAYATDATGAAGTDAVFIGTVGNLGPGSASDVRIALTDPTGVTPGPVTCEAFDGAVCPTDLAARPMTAPLVPAGGRLRLRVPYATPPDLRGDITGTFSATTPSDPSPDNNTASATQRLVAPTAALAVTHGVASSTAAGSSASFQARVVNRGGTPSFSLVLTQSLPDGLAATGWTCSASVGASCPAVLGPAMTLASLPGGASLTFGYRVAMPLSLAGSDVASTFQVTAEGVPASADTVAVATTSVRQAQADLQVRQTAPAQASAGAPVQFTVNATNLGPDVARGATLAHALSGAFVAGSVRFTCTATGGAACPATPGATQTLPDMPVGGSVRLLVEATAGAAGGSMTGQATGRVPGDPQTANDRDEDTVALVPPPARLSATMTAPATAPTGGRAAFTARVTNGGPESATNVAIEFSASGLAGTPAVSCTASAGATCPTTPGATTRAPTLAAGAWLQLRYELPVPADATLGSLVTGRVAASADGDPASGDNLADATSTVVASAADLQVSASLPSTVPQGEALATVVVLGNRGPSAALGASLSYAAPLPDVPVTVQCRASGGAACPASLANPSELAIDNLPVGGSLRLVYSQATAGVAAGTAVTATATVRYAGDPEPGNDEAAVSATVTGPADPRNGDYRLYAADGRQRTLKLDFDRLQLTIDGTARSFTGPDAEGVYTAGGARRFRIADGLVVGLDDSGGTLLPYVAARSFVTDLAALGSGTDLVLMGRSLDAGVPGSRYAGARWSQDTLQVCGSGTPLRIASCPAGAVTTYRLAVRSGSDVIDGTESSGSGQSLSFRVARVGSELVLLRAGASADGTDTLFQLGLAARAPAAAAYIGGTTTGDWGLGTLTVAPPALGFDGSTDDVYDLGADTTGWPQGLLGGVRTRDGAAAFVFGSPHLLIAVIARTAPSAGFVSIGLVR